MTPQSTNPTSSILNALDDANMNADYLSSSDSSSESSSSDENPGQHTGDELEEHEPDNEISDNEEPEGELREPSKKRQKMSVITRKQKRRGPGKKNKKAMSIPPEVLRRKITYNVSVFSAQQMKRPKSKRGDPVCDFVQLHEDLAWDTVKAQLMAKIESILKPASIRYEDYNVTFAIPRHSPQPMPLNDAGKYAFLVERALKIKTDPAVKIVVEAKVLERPKKTHHEKENEEEESSESDGSDDDLMKKKKKKKKTMVPNAKQVLPGNKALNDQIGAIRAKWACSKPGGICGSEHCFIQPDSNDHFPLSFSHLESWAAAILKGPQYATINTPPNNEKFDALGARALGEKSPLLQRRQQLNAEAKTTTTQEIHNHMHIPPELLGVFRPQATAPTSASDTVPIFCPQRSIQVRK